MRHLIDLFEDAFVSKSASGFGFVGLSIPDLWFAIREDAIPGDPKLVKTMAEAKGDAILEFDRSKINLNEDLSLQPALVAIHVNRGLLEAFLEERELDVIFLGEQKLKEQTEMMAWFLRTSPMIKDRK